MTLCIVGFDDLVTSFVATIATGWSDPCRVGLSPTEKPRLYTAHTIIRVEPSSTYMSGQVSRAHLVLLAREQRLAPLFSSSPFSSSAPSGHSPVPAASIRAARRAQRRVKDGA